MKVILMVVGKTSARYLSEGEAEYSKRINRYLPFEQVVISDLRSTRSLTAARQKALEGERIMGALESSDIVVLLDERGRQYTSREFADFVSKRLSTGAARRLVFVVGGPYGFSDEVYARADFKLSLSSMTFSHEMVRLFFTEQIYRAMTILNGEPYHHD